MDDFFSLEAALALAIGSEFLPGMRPSSARRLGLFVFRFALFVAVAWLGGRTECGAEEQTPPAKVAASVTSPITVQDVEIGFAGKGKLGFFLPVTVTFTTLMQIDDVTLSVIAPDSEGVPCEFFDERAFSIAPGETKKVVVGARIGRRSGPIIVRIANRNGVFAQQIVPQEAYRGLAKGTQELVLASSGDMDMSQVVRLRQQPADMELVVATLPRWDSLPTNRLLLEGVDAIVLTTATSQKVDQLSEETWELLYQYVIRGGKILISCGSRGADLLGEQGSLKRFIRSDFARVRNERDTTGLEGFAGTSERLDLVPRPDGGSFSGLDVSQLGVERGVVDAFDGMGDQRVAWVIRSRLGFGMVTLLTADLETYPLAQWNGRSRLIARLLDVTLGKSQESDAEGADRTKGELAQIGFRDLAGQLRMALDFFPGVSIIPFSAVLVFVTVCILAVSLGDYLVSHRLFKLPILTWGVLPATVLLLSAGTYWMAERAKGEGHKLNQLEIMDLDFSQGVVRGHSWFRLFFSRPERHDVSMKPELTKIHSHASMESVTCSWMGLPGGGLGGMDSSAGSAPRTEGYRSVTTSANGCALVSVKDVAIPQWSSRGFVGTWEGTIPERELPLLMVNSSSRVTGRIVNPTGIKLKDCILFHDEWCYDIGTLEPEGEALLDDTTALRDTSSRLTRRRIIEDKEITPVWDKTSQDLPRIAEMLMFHEAAGGIEYTDLIDRYYRRMDASAIMQLDAAVLMGKVDHPFSQIEGFKRGDQDPMREQRWGFIRIYLPVERSRAKQLP